MNSRLQHLQDFAGASLASFLATVADGLLYALLIWLIGGDTPTDVGIAAALGALLGGVIHYSLSRFWVFERFDAPLARSAVTYFAMSWLAAAIHGVLTGWLSTLVGESWAWFGSKAVVWVFWTYPMSRYVVFGGLGADQDGS
jgi:hypothetical protein